MKINEFFTQNSDTQINFDVVDDTIVFMRNDPMFYRKNYFPTMSKMADMHRAGKDIDPEALVGPVVDQAMEGYCKRYKLTRSPSELYTTEDRLNLINRITTEELEEIAQGGYK